VCCVVVCRRRARGVQKLSLEFLERCLFRMYITILWSEQPHFYSSAFSFCCILLSSENFDDYFGISYTDAAFAVGHLMASAPTADIHSKQLREMFEQATVEPTPGPGLGFTLCQETIPDPAAFNSSRVRALLLQDPHNSERWLQQFQQAEGRAWEGGIDGGLNGLFGCSKVSI